MLKRFDSSVCSSARSSNISLSHFADVFLDWDPPAGMFSVFSWPGGLAMTTRRVTTSTRRPGYFWPAGGGLTWLGFGFAPRFPFNLGGGGFVGLGSRLFALLAALAHPPPGAAGHQQGRGRLSACKGKDRREENMASRVSLCCRVSTSRLSQELFLRALCVFFPPCSKLAKAPACRTASNQ